MQTDRWKPHGLILRQRNSPDSMPQRFLGKASVLIACPELFRDDPPPSSMLSANQETSASPLLFDASRNSNSQCRDILELKMYPSAKAGGRQIQTSHSGSRPTKALSKLYLSSDGISQKYIAPSPRSQDPSASSSFASTPSALFQDVQQRMRPTTSQR